MSGEQARWTWTLAVDLDDPDLSEDLARGWASQAEAEDWLKDVFGDLLAVGAEEATLVEGTRQVYSMRLDADT